MAGFADGFGPEKLGEWWCHSPLEEGLKWEQVWFSLLSFRWLYYFQVEIGIGSVDHKG